jgi:quinol monooxygenase YgiN
MLTVVAIAQAKPGKEKDLEAALLELVPHTRQEAACINYDLHRHLDNPGKFVFYENWVNKAALEQHLTTPHITDFLTKAGDLLAEPLQVELYEMVSQQATKK